METPPGHGHPQRAQAACTYCRRRKMKCNNEQPRCMNCRAFDQECVYARSSKKKRTTVDGSSSLEARMSQLEEENRNLRIRLADTRSPAVELIDQPSHQDCANRIESDQGHGVISVVSNAAISKPASKGKDRRGIAEDYGRPMENASTNIGLTNVSASKDTPRISQYSGPFSRPCATDFGDLEKRIEAEAANQRRLEASNYYSQKLDFDGVEPDLAMHLLSSHWNRQHHSFLVTYRPAFMRDMAREGPYFSKLLLNAIYLDSSRFSSRVEIRSNPADVRTAGWKFRQKCKEYLATAIEKSEITTIQALLMMACSLFALGEEKSVAWTYAGIAFRMIIDLGMHFETSSSGGSHAPSAEELEVRRRVFWAAFVIDKIQSLYQGRPVNLQWDDCKVPLVFLDQYEEAELWQPFDLAGSPHYPQTPTYSISTFANLCKLCIVMNEVLNKMYAKRSQEQGLERLRIHVHPLFTRLQQWYVELDDNLKFDPSDPAHVVPPPPVLSLLCTYHVLLIQLHHPFIARGHSSPAPVASDQGYFGICANAANEIVLLLTVYNRTFSIRKAPYLLAFATYVSATIHVHAAARHLPDPEINARLRTCLDLLKQNRDTNPGVDNAIASLTKLMTQLGVVCPEPQIASETQEETGCPSSSLYQGTLNRLSPQPKDASREERYAKEGPSVEGSVVNQDGSSNAEAISDNLFENFAETQPTAGQFDTLMLDQLTPLQYRDTAIPASLDFTAGDPFGLSLLDPADVDYSQLENIGGGKMDFYSDTVH